MQCVESAWPDSSGDDVGRTQWCMQVVMATVLLSHVRADGGILNADRVATHREVVSECLRRRLLCIGIIAENLWFLSTDIPGAICICLSKIK